MPDTPTSELAEFCLPCEQCATQVVVRSDRARQFIDLWLDGLLTVRCVLHKARAEGQP